MSIAARRRSSTSTSLLSHYVFSVKLTVEPLLKAFHKKHESNIFGKTQKHCHDIACTSVRSTYSTVVSTRTNLQVVFMAECTGTIDVQWQIMQTDIAEKNKGILERLQAANQSAMPVTAAGTPYVFVLKFFTNMGGRPKSARI